MTLRAIFGDGSMLQFFRNFFSSKLGVGVTIAMLVMITLAFAGGDVASSGGFGGVAGGDRIATVGKRRISTADVERAAGNAVEQLKERDPTLTMPTFMANGGLEEVLSNLIDLSAIRAFGENHGIRVGDRLVDSEIAKIPGVQGPDGKPSEQLYQAWLAQKRLTDSQLRGQVIESIMARQLLTSASFGVTVPREATIRYAAVAAETRAGQIAMLPSAAFAPKTAPSEAEINGFYATHRGDYMQPERRVIRYAMFDESVVKNAAAPTDAEIAARYEANKAQYAGSQTRRITQLILPTEAAAKAVLAEAKGKSLEAVAREKGLTAASLGELSKQSLAGQSSQAVADASFAADRGAIIGPLKGPLGWHLMRVDAVTEKPTRTLAQVRGELSTQIAAEKHRAALTEFSAKIEDEFDNGASLSDVAKELDLTVEQTAPLTADGKVFGKPDQTAPVAIARLIQPSFSMEGENQPQLAEVEPGKKFAIYDVGAIAAAAPPPLAEIRAQVIADVQLSKGSVAAKAAAQKIEAAARKGEDIRAAMAALGVALPPVDQINMPRMQIEAMGQKAPVPLVQLFSIARGSVKLLGAPRNRGWYVIKVTGITPGTVAANDPRLVNFAQGLSAATAREYSDQLRAAQRNRDQRGTHPPARR